MEGDRAVYSCPLCGDDIQERDKTAMLAEGRWEPTAVCDPDTRGYHLNQLYSPWTEWRDVLRRSEAAKGVPEREKTFVNTALARTWGPPTAEVPEIEELMARAEPWLEGTVPAGGCFLTAGADVQADRIEVEIVSWGRSFESMVRRLLRPVRISRRARRLGAIGRTALEELASRIWNAAADSSRVHRLRLQRERCDCVHAEINMAEGSSP